MTLEDLRLRIDALDRHILSLLRERADVAVEIAGAKRREGHESFRDPAREREVLDRVESIGAGLFPRASIRAVFREIMSACLSLEEPIRVAYLGPEGTFSHRAAREIFGSAAIFSDATSIDSVFDAVERDHARFGVVPIESLAQGSVDSTLDALLRSSLYIQEELVLSVSHCLLSRASSVTDIEQVFSHPQALDQCRLWLARHLPQAQLVPTASTAAAAQRASVVRGAAAIASRLAAELHDLPVLYENIQDHSRNATRFIVVAKQDGPQTGDDKTSVAFSAPDETGALRRALTIFADHGINLSRIESRPSGSPWEYVFFVDIAGHRGDPHVALALEALKTERRRIRILGSYPRDISGGHDASSGTSGQAGP